jgi:hypothetical protein
VGSWELNIVVGDSGIPVQARGLLYFFPSVLFRLLD